MVAARRGGRSTNLGRGRGRIRPVGAGLVPGDREQASGLRIRRVGHSAGRGAAGNGDRIGARRGRADRLARTESGTPGLQCLTGAGLQSLGYSRGAARDTRPT